jgi:2-(1,2-epoxy-1,2-dihydrophenyl)acetyl-CoA isomerase
LYGFSRSKVIESRSALDSIANGFEVHMENTVLFARVGTHAVITLNRPEALNALNAEMVEDLSAVIRQVAADGKIGALVIKGSGGHFMAGGDIRMFAETLDLSPSDRREEFIRLIERVHALVLAIRNLDVCTIASVQGAAVGFGMSLVMLCDLALASEQAYFNLAYATLGASPDGSATYYLPRIVGFKRAMEVALLAERFDARTAMSLGLVNRVIPDAELDAQTTAWADRLAAGPRLAYRNTKRLLARSLTGTLEDQLQAEAQGFADCAATSDFTEGVRAFLERRRPQFGLDRSTG